MEHEYITLKLVNGDNLICLMVDEDDDKFIIMYPIQMKSVRITTNGINKEVLAGSPWCSFTDHEVFQIWKNDVIIIKPMNESTIEYYKRLIDVEIDSYEYTPDDEESDSPSEVQDDIFLLFGNDTVH